MLEYPPFQNKVVFFPIYFPRCRYITNKVKWKRRLNCMICCNIRKPHLRAPWNISSIFFVLYVDIVICRTPYHYFVFEFWKDTKFMQLRPGCVASVFIFLMREYFSPFPIFVTSWNIRSSRTKYVELWHAKSNRSVSLII